jgi:hypothetical protein
VLLHGFVNEKDCVYCAVRANCLSTISVRLIDDRVKLNSYRVFQKELYNFESL